MNGTEEPWSKWQTISTKCHQFMLLVGEAMLYLTSCMLIIQIIITNYWHQHFLLAFFLYQHISIPETVAWTSHQQNLHNFFLSSLPWFFLFPSSPPPLFLLFFLSCLSFCPSVFFDRILLYGSGWPVTPMAFQDYRSAPAHPAEVSDSVR